MQYLTIQPCSGVPACIELIVSDDAPFSLDLCGAQAIFDVLFPQGGIKVEQVDDLTFRAERGTPDAC